DRGLIAEGMYADITIFDPQSVIDRATYDDPQLHSEGIKYVVVNGVVTVEDGEHTGAIAGRVLRKEGLGEES
nr:amidohydrolase family protein [Nitrososphaeria archaeon]